MGLREGGDGSLSFLGPACALKPQSQVLGTEGQDQPCRSQCGPSLTAHPYPPLRDLNLFQPLIRAHLRQWMSHLRPPPPQPLVAQGLPPEERVPPWLHGKQICVASNTSLAFRTSFSSSATRDPRALSSSDCPSLRLGGAKAVQC